MDVVLTRDASVTPRLHHDGVERGGLHCLPWFAAVRKMEDNLAEPVHPSQPRAAIWETRVLPALARRAGDATIDIVDRYLLSEDKQGRLRWSPGLLEVLQELARSARDDGAVYEIRIVTDDPTRYDNDDKERRPNSEKMAGAMKQLTTRLAGRPLKTTVSFARACCGGGFIHDRYMRIGALALSIGTGLEVFTGQARPSTFTTELAKDGYHAKRSQNSYVSLLQSSGRIVGSGKAPADPDSWVEPTRPVREYCNEPRKSKCWAKTYANMST